MRHSPQNERRMPMGERKTRQLKELNLMDDFLFGSMVNHPEIGEKFIKRLLETILHRRIHKITVIGQKVIYGRDTKYHGIRIDVEITEERDGEVETIYDLEPDLKSSEKSELPRRTRYYHSMIDSRTIKTSTKYSRLPNVYVIVITDFDPFGEERMVYTMKTMCVEYPELSYEDGSRTIYLYTKGSAGNPPQELRELLRYMEETNHKNAVNNTLRDIDDMVEKVKNDEEVTAMHWEITADDLYEMGMENGIKKGRIEGIISTVGALKEADVPPDKIINVLVHNFKISFDEAKEYISQ